MNIRECEIFEVGRRLGVRQAMLFLVEVNDEPTLAEEIGKYVLPGRQWRRRLNKEFLKAGHRPERGLSETGNQAGRGRVLAHEVDIKVK